MRRTLVWAAAGACLSPTLGLLAWFAIGPDLRFLPAVVAPIGAGAGALASRRFRPATDHAAAVFIVAYLYQGALATLPLDGARFTLAAAAVVTGFLLVVRAIDKSVTPATRWEVAKFYGAVAWVVTGLLLPLYLAGLIVLPVAAAATARSRALAPLDSAQVPA